MDIPNLSQTSTPIRVEPSKKGINYLPIIIIAAIAVGFGLSRILPTGSTTKAPTVTTENGEKIETTVESKDEVKVGKTYGNSSATYKDSTSGTIQKGSINGEGTHILVREGGDSQRVSLTSSAVDLDLFVDRKVEVKGETNSSKKTGWLLDVGTVKVLE